MVGGELQRKVAGVLVSTTMVCALHSIWYSALLDRPFWLLFAHAWQFFCKAADALISAPFRVHAAHSVFPAPRGGLRGLQIARGCCLLPTLPGGEWGLRRRPPLASSLLSTGACREV